LFKRLKNGVVRGPPFELAPSLKGRDGDADNAILTAVGYNLRLVLALPQHGVALSRDEKESAANKPI